MSAGLYEQPAHTKENMGLAPSQLKLLLTKTLSYIATIITIYYHFNGNKKNNILML